MSYIKVWIHAVWSTKKREPLLHQNFRQNLFKYIIENTKEKDTWVDCIGGYNDHIHILVQLKSDQTLSKVIQLIKGESSFWVNDNGLLDVRFEWQREYYAVSVSEDKVERVRNYIKNQKEHHERNSYSNLEEELKNI